MKCFMFKILVFLLMLVQGVLLYKPNRDRLGDRSLSGSGVPNPSRPRISPSNETSSPVPINFGPGDNGPGDVRPGDVRPGDVRPGDVRPGDVRPGDTRPGDTRPGDTRPGDTRPGDTRPGDTRPGDTRPGDIRPDDNVIHEGQYRTKDRPECDYLEGEGFCHNDTEYNQTIVNLFNKIISSKEIPGVFTEVLNETVIPIDKSALRPNVRNRIGFSSETPLCPSTETIIYPKRGQTANKDWVFILNQGPVQQGVRVEKCVSPNAPCKLGGGPLDQTFCRQKYIYKKLLAMDTSGNNIVSESIYMPSCCVCYISNDFTLRSAAGTADFEAKSSPTAK